MTNFQGSITTEECITVLPEKLGDLVNLKKKKKKEQKRNDRKEVKCKGASCNFTHLQKKRRFVLRQERLYCK